MTFINRRQLIGGATALFADLHLPMALGLQENVRVDDSTPKGLKRPPKNLLSSTFTPELLSRSLIPVSTWHPFAKADERETWQGIPADIRRALVQRAEAVLGTQWAWFPATVYLEYKRTGVLTHYSKMHFARRQRLTDLVLGECVEGNGRFLDEIVNGIWLMCEETSWSFPVHISAQKAGLGLPDVTEPLVDLFSAETGEILSWTHYLLASRLNEVSPLIPQRIEIETKRRILDPAFERDDFWWMWGGADGKHRLGNWNPWINSNWLSVNLLMERDPARRISATSKICKSLDLFLSEYSPDGGCDEGQFYWGVTGPTYFNACALLKSATGGAADALGDPFVRKMMHFIADVHISGNHYFDYGDAHGDRSGPSAELLYRIGAGVGDKTLMEYGAFRTSITDIRDGKNSSGGEGHLGGEGRLGRALPEILNAAEVWKAEKADALERDSWYPALCLMTARIKKDSSNGLYLGVMAAANLRGHGHNDSGSFIVYHDGEPVFVDIGVESYTSKTFSSERYGIWTMQSAYHNLPTVGGVMQVATDPSCRASEVQYASDDDHAGLSMNLATAYPPDAGIVRWTRNITLDRKVDRIRLNEDFHLQRKVPVMLSFMTPRTPSQGPEGKIVLSAADKSVRDVYLTYNASLTAPKFEEIVLTDEGLRDAWGEKLYRVLLTSLEPTDGGEWLMEII